MPQHDPIPPRPSSPKPSSPEPVPPRLERAASAWAQYRRLMRWMALVAVAAALLALLYLRSTGSAMPLHMVIATFAGVSLTVLLGTALMGLVFVSAHSGHDDAATRKDSPQ